MFKHLQNLSEDDVRVKEAQAMRKDIPLITEMQMRDQMSVAILMAYVDHLECTKNPKEIKAMITDLAQKFQNTNFVTSSFMESVITQMNEKLSRKNRMKEKIKMQFLKGPKINKALESFSDPRLVQEKCSVLNSIQDTETENLNAVMEVYLDDIMVQMKKTLSFDHEFLKKI